MFSLPIMTLQQLRYIIAVAEKGTVSGAAQSLFISQPSLTASVKELEREMGITIFSRTNKGVSLTPDGEEFLGYARQVIEQTNLIRRRYRPGQGGKYLFCVSAQHYSFVVEAFVDLVRETGGSEYDVRIRETQTYEIIEDVAKLRSEVGVLYLNPFNETVLRKTLRDNDLTFTPLFKAKPHVFVGESNPLASKQSVTLDDLLPYPRLSYEQGEHNAFYFSEEILSVLDSPKNIRVRDRATLFNLLIGLNGYTICSGVLNTEFNGQRIRAIPLEADDYMEVGYITHNKVVPGQLALRYIEALRRHVPWA